MEIYDGKRWNKLDLAMENVDFTHGNIVFFGFSMVE